LEPTRRYAIIPCRVLTKRSPNPATRRSLTKSFIDSLEPRTKEFTVWDADVKWLGLRVRPHGSKIFVVRYRGARSRQRWVTIGPFGGPATPDPVSSQPRTWTVEVARNEALRLLGESKAGEDPSERRSQARRMPTVTELSERYLTDYAVPIKQPRSVAEDRGNLKRHVLPAIGKLLVSEVATSHVQRIQADLKAEGKEVTSNRVLALISTMFKQAELWGYRPQNTNPAKHVGRVTEHGRRCYLDVGELEAVGAAIRKGVESEAISPVAASAIRLLMFTGARPSEVVNRRREEVDSTAGVLHVPDPKEGEPKAVPLSPPALTVIAEAPVVEGNPYLLPGRVTGQPISLSAVEHAWVWVRDEAKLKDVKTKGKFKRPRLHDLRHSTASLLVSSGYSLELIGSLLGHKSPQTTKRYAHLYEDARQSAADKLGSTVAAALSPKPRRNPA
jgi:integrase